MNQAQPSTTTPEAALRPASGRKTATGVFDTWSEANLWERQTFTTELRWGVRYSQSDPLGEASFHGLTSSLRVIGKNRNGLPSESHAFGYADFSPLRRTDPLGLYSINDNCQGCETRLANLGVDKQQVIAGILLTKRLIENGCIGESAITRCMLDKADPSSSLKVNCPQPNDGTRCDDPMIESFGFAQRKMNTVNICPRSFPTSPMGKGSSEHEVASTFFQELAHVCGAKFAAPDQGDDMANEAFSNYFTGKCGN